MVVPPVTTGTPGSANFAKFVAIGNSFVAGVQGGALFTEGQNNSLPAIMANQFAISGVGGGPFVQPKHQCEFRVQFVRNATHSN
ncbi:MAG: hypothetical protein U5K54_17260 [Cytophagales bacterium]|nr:hypothetical protein [Cytophagales bacterium]